MSTPTPPKSPYDASAAAAGYAMQMRYALYLAVQRLRSGLDWQISIEAGDDIEVQRSDGIDYLQLKHRAEGTSLTNSSSDLWKSLRVWADSWLDGGLDLAETNLYLMTTGTAPRGTVAASLTDVPNQRDEDSALTTLDTIANSSGNQENAKAYAAWNSLPAHARKGILARTVVVPQGPNIDSVEHLLEEQCSLSVRRTKIKAFVTRLEGWWFQRCILVLRASGAFIRAEELDAQMDDLRESFLPENLPIDSDLLAYTIQNIEPFKSHLFVRQIDLVGISTSRIASAIRDYMRAYTQRSRWARECLVGPDELGQYERRLTEEWRYLFDRCTDDLSPEAAEAEKSLMARRIYAWVEDCTTPYIRERCSEPFLVRGSLHILANRMESGVGWHPEFAARLMAVLEPAD